MRVSYSAQADADLDAIKSYISENASPETAELIIQRLLQAIAALERFPLLGREGRVEGTREFKIAGLPYYAVYHIVSETELTVISIMHERRRYPPGSVS